MQQSSKEQHQKTNKNTPTSYNECKDDKAQPTHRTEETHDTTTASVGTNNDKEMSPTKDGSTRDERTMKSGINMDSGINKYSKKNTPNSNIDDTDDK